MALSYTLASLKAAIVEWLEDDGAEFAAVLDSLIKLAEQKIYTDMPFSVFDEVATGSLTTNVLAKPATMVRVVDIFVTVAGEQVLLEPKQWGYVNLHGGSGVPLYYAHQDEGNLIFAPAPASSTPYTLRYVARPASLVDSPSGTWISEKLPDVLFWGCIVHSEHFRKADDRIPVAREMYAAAKDTALSELSNLIRMEYK